MRKTLNGFYLFAVPLFEATFPAYTVQTAISANSFVC
jgi:hypothetical protein